MGFHQLQWEGVVEGFHQHQWEEGMIQMEEEEGFHQLQWEEGPDVLGLCRQVAGF